MSRTTSALGCLAAAMLIPFGIVWGVVWGGWAILVLWNWFVVPLGVPALTFAGACGVDALAGAFQHEPPDPPPDQTTGFGRKIALALLRPVLKSLVYVAIGYTLHHWFL